jgi:hypothetical protein
MAWIYADRVLDTSVTAGTGSLTVSGASPLGWRTFSTVCAVADQFYYTIVDPITGAWETGEGTYSAANTVARTTFRASSTGSAVSFAANTKNVFLDVIGRYFATAGVGVLQTVSFETGAVATGTTIIPFDDTIPQITEGNEYMTLAITPRSATSKLIIEVACMIASNTVGTANTAALFQDSTANALAAWCMDAANANYRTPIVFTHTMISGTTSSTTFRVRAGANVAGTTSFNGQNGVRLFGGVMASSIVIQEVV